MRPFRFGVTIGHLQNRTAFVEQIRRAEDAGFHVLAGVDHIGPPPGVLPMLAVAAEISRLRIGTMVLANDYRHPVIVAKDAATIDVLSEGRFELGIGTGWIREQYDSAGIAFDNAHTRVDRLEEAIQVIKGCWSGAPFTFAGDHYEVDLVGSPQPVQVAGPPILIGASGPRMLRLAAREADIVGITVTRGQDGFSTFGRVVATSGERFAEQLQVVRDAAGERFEEIEVSVMIHLFEPDGARAQAFAEDTGVPSDVMRDSPHVLAGSPEEMADALIERRATHGVSYIVFRGADLADAAGVVTRLSGT